MFYENQLRAQYTDKNCEAISDNNNYKQIIIMKN